MGAEPTTIRLAVAADAPPVARIQVAAWDRAYRGILPADNARARTLYEAAGFELDGAERPAVPGVGCGARELRYRRLLAR